MKTVMHVKRIFYAKACKLPLARIQTEYRVTVKQTSNCQQIVLSYLCTCSMFLAYSMNTNSWKCCEHHLCFERRKQFSFYGYVINFTPSRTIFKNYRMTGMRLLPLHALSACKIRILLNTMNVNITSNMDNDDFKVHMRHVKQLDWQVIRQNLGMFTNIFGNHGEKKKELVSTAGQYIQYFTSLDGIKVIFMTNIEQPLCINIFHKKKAVYSCHWILYNALWISFLTV